MLEALGLVDSAKILVYLMVSFAFFVGIMLIVSYEAFRHFNASLQKEYGMRKRIAPSVEDTSNSFVDWVVSRYPVISGLLIAVSSFILLLIYKP